MLNDQQFSSHKKVTIQYKYHIPMKEGDYNFLHNLVPSSMTSQSSVPGVVLEYKTPLGSQVCFILYNLG